ncbi:40S ribosomal protein S7 [Diplonema papillatum]|nr:40S ribosomal protein S7 [Diplonema papillatum]
MSTPAMKKIRKSHRSEATELEMQVAQVLYDLEQNSKNLKTSLTGFVINHAREVEVTPTKSCVLVQYPLRFMRKVHKVQKALVAELEKKLHKNAVFVAQRKISVNRSATSQRSRTMKAVHEAYLDDICYPSEICSKRVRQLTDGSKHLKVFLDQKEKERAGGKLDSFVAAYNKLTGRSVSFGFMSSAALQQVSV